MKRSLNLSTTTNEGMVLLTTTPEGMIKELMIDPTSISYLGPSNPLTMMAGLISRNKKSLLLATNNIHRRRETTEAASNAVRQVTLPKNARTALIETTSARTSQSHVSSIQMFSMIQTSSSMIPRITDLRTRGIMRKKKEMKSARNLKRCVTTDLLPRLQKKTKVPKTKLKTVMSMKLSLFQTKIHPTPKMTLPPNSMSRPWTKSTTTQLSRLKTAQILNLMRLNPSRTP